MSTSNPYRAPQAGLELPRPSGLGFSAPARRVAARQGGHWLAEGWRLLRAAPWLWLAVALLFWLLPMLLSLLPVLGNVASLLAGPLMVAGVAAFAHTQSETGEADFGRFFTGFREKTGPLLVVALLYVAVLLVMLLAAGLLLIFLTRDMAALPWQDVNALADVLLSSGTGLGILLSVVLALLGIFMAVAAYWFAPALVLLADMDPMQAMKASLQASLVNWRAFLVYSLAGLGLLLLGLLPLGLGLLVVFPLMAASYYPSFSDLFARRPD